MQIYNHTNNQSRPVRSRPSLLETLEQVKHQVDYEYLGREINGRMYVDPVYNNLCLIIAEMYITPPDTLVRIRGIQMEAGAVCEIYRELRREHIEMTADNFKRQTKKVVNTSAYLQTALYNSYLEMYCHYTNKVNCDMYGN